VDRDEVRVIRDNSFCYEVTVFLPDSTVAPPTLFTRESLRARGLLGGSSISVPLKKGESEKSHLEDLNRWFDMTLAGKYTVRIRGYYPSRLDPDAKIEVFSNEIEIFVD